MSKKGFSLIELIVVISIISILALIGIPQLNKWRARYRVKNFSYSLASNISYARTVSKKDGKRVVVAIVNSGSNPQNWTSNSSIDPVIYLIFEDFNNNQKYDSGEKIIAYGNGKGISIIDNTIPNSCMGGSSKCVLFFPVGPPLLGVASLIIKVGSASYGNIEYDVNLQGVTGITEVKTVK